MLTARGFWFFVTCFTILAMAIILAAHTLSLTAATLLIWFVGHWLLFQMRVHLSINRLTLERSIATARGEVDSVWARQRIEITVALHSSSWLDVPYLVMTDRLPTLARLKQGTLRIDGPLADNTPMQLTYAIDCPAPGWLRFYGVKVLMTDQQGFFTYSTFVRDDTTCRVLPMLNVDKSHSTFVKQHNALPLVGTHRHARAGSSSELLDLRDYLPGDPPKLIAWKVSARRDRLITRIFESEVPIRCTIFLDTSHSVRVGPVGETALSRLTELTAGIAQANTAERDLTGLCLFDSHEAGGTMKPGRGAKHLFQMLGLLTDVAGLIPHTRRTTVRELIPVAYALARDLYPELLDSDVNTFPWWLPFWSPQPKWTIPPGAPRVRGRFSPAYHREYRQRKQLSAILAVRYNLGEGGLALLLENDERSIHYLQRFLVEHQIAFPFTHFDADGRYLLSSPSKAKVLAKALLRNILHAKDNELYVLCVDLLEATDDLAELERAVCLAKAKHHQVVAICPWPPGVDIPGTPPPPLTDLALSERDHADRVLQRLVTHRFHEAFAEVRRRLGRVGIPVICAAERDTVRQILQRIQRLRAPQRSMR